MDSVEIPPFEEVLLTRRARRAASHESLEAAGTPSTSGGRVIRKMKPSGKSIKKMSALFNPFISSSSPIPAPHLPTTVGVRLSRTASLPATILRSSSSSDDDPRYGQVTPHHLISPPPRKALDMFDPPSDDSLASSSPTKTAATRWEMRRTGSLGNAA
jgi:hypothetical protein